MASIGRLLKLSPYLRGLFLRFPETTLQDILEHLPQPVASLLRVSWALQNLSNEHFLVDMTLERLRSTDLLEWSLLYPRILDENDDALHVAYGLIDLYVEVDVAAGLVAQGMHAAMETCVNPYVVVAPLVLSSTEKFRFVCSLFVAKIYFQLEQKFRHSDDGQSSKVPVLFMRGLEPWLVEQAVSVEVFLCNCRDSHDFTVYTVIDQRYTCMESLSEKTLYFRKFFQATGNTVYRGWFRNRLSALRTALGGRFNDIPHSSTAPDVTTQFSSPGWILYRTPRFHRHQEYFCLGVFFWDQDRLTQWDIVDHKDITMAMEEFRNNYHRNLHWGSHPPGNIPKTQSRQIIQWTRCPVQCTIEEFLYQKTALARIVDGRPPLPSKYIRVGMKCSICGLDGHIGFHCHETGWSDDEQP